MKHRLLAILLSLTMVMSFAPVSALAPDETEDHNSTTIEVGTQDDLVNAFGRINEESS